jgi:hypothetical protein
VKLFRFVILVAAVAIVVFPAGIALGQPPADAFRALPDTVERGETFNVTVNFTAPADNFSAPALTDFCPAGWNVTVSGSWTQPPATVLATGNKADFIWWQNFYPNGTNFTALYKVTVPCDANLTNYTFDEDNWAYLSYFIGNSSQIWGNITGDSNVTVVPPAICSTPSIEFYAAYNGTNPQNRTLDVWSSTPCPLNWSLSDDADWLEAYPTNGTCTDAHVSVNLSANSSGMPMGNYTANITIESPEANNSPRTVPVILHITLTGTLKGQVDLSRKQPQGDPTWETPLVVSFFDNVTKLEMAWSPRNVTTDAYGNFTIGDIVVGTYDVGVKNYTTLSKMVYGKAFTAGNITPADFGTLIEGDTDNDDKVKLGDFNRVLNNFGAKPGDAAWDPNYDFDRNGKVDLVDFNLVLNNFGGKGDIYYYLP